MQAMAHSVANVRNSYIGSYRTLFCCAVLVWIFSERPVAMNKEVSWGNGFAIGDAGTLKLSFKMPYFPD